MFCRLDYISIATTGHESCPSCASKRIKHQLAKAQCLWLVADCGERSCCILNVTKRICDIKFSMMFGRLSPLDITKHWTTAPATWFMYSLPRILITSHNRNTACTLSERITSSASKVINTRHWITTTSDRSARYRRLLSSLLVVTTSAAES
jgi:hypothetical protein